MKIVTIFLLITLSACGMQGDLYLPKQKNVQPEKLVMMTSNILIKVK